VLSCILQGQVAKEADIRRHLHVFTLYNIRMTASAMEVNTSAVFGEMRLVIKDDIPFCKTNL
jgi:hypothetical protein